MILSDNQVPVCPCRCVLGARVRYKRGNKMCQDLPYLDSKAIPPLKYECEYLPRRSYRPLSSNVPSSPTPFPSVFLCSHFYLECFPGISSYCPNCMTRLHWETFSILVHSWHTTHFTMQILALWPRNCAVLVLRT